MIARPMKRFWRRAQVGTDGAAFTVLLDSRRLRTPGKASLDLPTRGLAEAIAAEWNAIGTMVDPEALPLTRAANSAIDRVGPAHDLIVANLAAYGENDLLCYRAEAPQALSALQAAAWDPLLDWAAADLAARLWTTAGLMPHPQPPASLAALKQTLAAFDPFALTAVSDLVTISGSLVLGLAVARGRLDAGEAFEISRVDEIWQNAAWGVDAEQEAVVARRLRDITRAAELLKLLSEPTVNADSH